MLVKVQCSRLRQSEWWEYVVRFVFGGVVVVITGMIASKWGAVIGGLFLAFPGIFPASVTLVERHEKQKKRRHGYDGRRRGRSASAVVSAGAALGSVGLIAFAALAWLLLPRAPAWVAITAATLGWFAVSALAWFVRIRA